MIIHSKPQGAYAEKCLKENRAPISWGEIGAYLHPAVLAPLIIGIITYEPENVKE